MFDGRIAASRGRIRQRPAGIAPRTFLRVDRARKPAWSGLQDARASMASHCVTSRVANRARVAQAWRNVVAMCRWNHSARVQCGRGFQLFHDAGLATHRQRHHCL